MDHLAIVVGSASAAISAAAISALAYDMFRGKKTKEVPADLKALARSGQLKTDQDWDRFYDEMGEFVAMHSRLLRKLELRPDSPERAEMEKELDLLEEIIREYREIAFAKDPTMVLQ